MSSPSPSSSQDSPQWSSMWDFESQESPDGECGGGCDCRWWRCEVLVGSDLMLEPQFGLEVVGTAGKSLLFGESSSEFGFMLKRTSVLFLDAWSASSMPIPTLPFPGCEGLGVESLGWSLRPRKCLVLSPTVAGGEENEFTGGGRGRRW